MQKSAAVRLFFAFFRGERKDYCLLLYKLVYIWYNRVIVGTDSEDKQVRIAKER